MVSVHKNISNELKKNFEKYTLKVSKLLCQTNNFHTCKISNCEEPLTNVIFILTIWL